MSYRSDKLLAKPRQQHVTDQISLLLGGARGHVVFVYENICVCFGLMVRRVMAALNCDETVTEGLKQHTWAV